jgi:hypothetical protein
MSSTSSAPLRQLTSAWKSWNNGLKYHGSAFTGVIILLAVLDWWTGAPYWVHWVVLGWGTGLAFHAYLALNKKRRARA